LGRGGCRPGAALDGGEALPGGPVLLAQARLQGLHVHVATAGRRAGAGRASRGGGGGGRLTRAGGAGREGAGQGGVVPGHLAAAGGGDDVLPDLDHGGGQVAAGRRRVLDERGGERRVAAGAVEGDVAGLGRVGDERA